MNPVSLVQEIMRRHQQNFLGWTALDRPLSFAQYQSWLANGHHADMRYLEAHAPLKENPKSYWPSGKSAIVVGQRYFPHPYGKIPRLRSARIALYAQGEDYHFHFKAALERVAEDLKAAFPDEEFLCCTDSAPVLERDLGVRAGLGWIGKNTCLLHPTQGSLFFLGQILTSLPAPESPRVHPDRCGNCDRCLRACPTGALESPRVLNANKCISYWTIEAREVAPVELREKFGGWFFGCDICQTVCPWNEKVYGKSAFSSSHDGIDQELIEDLRWLLTSSHKTITRTLKSTPLLRARPLGLKRNALVVIGNLKIQELRNEVSAYLNDPQLGELAQWAIDQLRKS